MKAKTKKSIAIIASIVGAIAAYNYFLKDRVNTWLSQPTEESALLAKDGKILRKIRDAEGSYNPLEMRVETTKERLVGGSQTVTA